jgi:serine/threonine-protein kinase HipA
LADTLASVLRGPDGATGELAKFFRMLVLSAAVGNGDAHRKNFGVVYDDPTGEVTLAAAFDIITTTPYLPQDSMALTLDGTKRWPDRKRLQKFAMSRCQLTPAKARDIVTEVADGVADVAKDLGKIVELDNDAAPMAVRMSKAWAEGVASLR